MRTVYDTLTSTVVCEVDDAGRTVTLTLQNTPGTDVYSLFNVTATGNSTAATLSMNYAGAGEVGAALATGIGALTGQTEPQVLATGGLATLPAHERFKPNLVYKASADNSSAVIADDVLGTVTWRVSDSTPCGIAVTASAGSAAVIFSNLTVASQMAAALFGARAMVPERLLVDP